MIASLMMYDRPEVATEHAVYWRALRASLAQHGIDTPETLSNNAPVFDVWRAPDLVFSQTCGMPYRTFLADEVTLIGTPDFGIDECQPGHYRSAVVVRADDAREGLKQFEQARFAYNETGSQSGYAAIYALAQRHGFWFSDRVASGGHRASAQMVAEGRADIAAVDAQTWRYLNRFDSFANDLRVLDWTSPTPGLPYIAGQQLDGETMFNAVGDAIDGLPADVRDALDLRGIVRITRADYLAIENPPQVA